MTIKYHDILQGTDEWFEARCGLITASEVKHILTLKLKVANNDKVRANLYELVAQRYSKYVEPSYINDAMERGYQDEIRARILYQDTYSPEEEVKEIGFITNDKFGFTLGYSPDGLVGSDGLIEIKSRCQKYQVQTIIENQVPEEHLIQVQTALLVSERKWLDYISYCAGLPMFVIKVYPDKEIQEKIIEACTEFESKAKSLMDILKHNSAGLMPTEREAETGTEIYI
jgi:predicted phage-related endonuclease